MDKYVFRHYYRKVSNLFGGASSTAKAGMGGFKLWINDSFSIATAGFTIVYGITIVVRWAWIADKAIAFTYFGLLWASLWIALKIAFPIALMIAGIIAIQKRC